MNDPFRFLTQCLVTCGKGMRHRQVSCSTGATEEKLSEHFCDPSSKPPAVGSCELPECASWQVGVWGAVSCGKSNRKVHLYEYVQLVLYNILESLIS